MAAPAFLDTNIIVYAHDGRDSKKQQIARSLLKAAVVSGTGVVSTQVMQEFCNVMLRGRPPFMTQAELSLVVTRNIEPLVKHRPSVDFYLRSIQLYTDNSLSFYDAIIIQAALDLGCQTLYSEDLQAGQRFGNLEVKNPFA